MLHVRKRKEGSSQSPQVYMADQRQRRAGLNLPGSEAGVSFLTTYFLPKVLLYFGFQYERLMGFTVPLYVKQVTL